MMQQNEAEALEKLRKFEDTLTVEAEKNNGEIIKNYGDGALLLFDSAVHAAKCAISIQACLRQALVVPLRIGIHIGEIIRKGNDIFGDGVNIASRIESMGIPNSILTSSIVYEQLKNRHEFHLIPIGKFLFQNVTQGIDLYAVSNEGLAVPVAGKLKGKGQKVRSGLSPTWSLRTFVILTVAISLTIVLGWNIIQKFPSDLSFTPNPVVHEFKRIAVLPLINLNKNEQLEYFADGVTQEIIDELAKISKFRLSAFSSTASFKNSDKSLRQIAEELDVNLILAGSARIYKDSVRLSIELVDPYTNQRTWNKQYDELMSSAFRLQGDIARQVAEHLNINITPKERSALMKVNTNNPEAFDLVLKARAAYTSLEPEGFRESIGYLEKVIELDPNYTEAYTLLAWVHILRGFADIMADADHAMITVDKALPLISKAFELDPENSDNYLVRGALDLFYLNDPKSATVNVEKAIQMNAWPKVPTRYCICTVISTYAVTGRLEEAMSFVDIAKKIDPLNVFVFSDEGTVKLLQGNYQEAISSFEQALGTMDVPFFRHYLGWTYYHSGDYKSALRYLSSAMDGDAKPLGTTLAFLSNTYYHLGDVENSERLRKLLEERQMQDFPNQIIPLASIYAARGDYKESLKFLEMAYNDQEFGFAWYLSVDPVFDPMKDLPEFISLLNRPPFKVE